MARSTILALDVGDVRIGVAIADAELRFPGPLTTLANDDTTWDELQKIITKESVEAIVVGLPRGLGGQETSQTHLVQKFIDDIKTHFGLPVQAQDEALTSIKAEAELQSRGKPFKKEAVDSLAATYILEDYLHVGGATHADL